MPDFVLPVAAVYYLLRSDTPPHHAAMFLQPSAKNIRPTQRFTSGSARTARQSLAFTSRVKQVYP